MAIPIILRAYAKKKEDVQKQMEEVWAAVEAIYDLKIGEELLAARVVVWDDHDEYEGEADCGELFAVLQAKRDAEERRLYRDMCDIRRFERGDDFIDLLNGELAILANTGFEWFGVMSSEAKIYLTQDFCDQVAQAMEAGARHIGAALPELGERGRQGFFGNTLCFWHVPSFSPYLIFDDIARRKPGNKLQPKVKFFSEGKVQEEVCHGVEEVVTQARLFEKFGPCLAPIVVGDVGRYETDHMSDIRRLANDRKFASKQARQCWMLAQCGYDESLITSGVMDAFRLV